MYLDDSALHDVSELWANCISSTPSFMNGAPVKTENHMLPTESTIDFSASKSIYILKQGALKETYMNNVVINYEPGDLVGVTSLLNNCKTTVSTDFSVVVDEYNIKELMAFICSDISRFEAWNTYLLSFMQSYQILMCHHMEQEVQFHPEIRHYDEGDIIIEEDSNDNDVFTLISGKANVYVKDALVGEILRDELFGAIAALTNTARTATVKAESKCSVLVVPSTSFKELLISRPDTVAKLIEDMARSIISSNEKIIAQKSI
ncbi:MAG: cyclic nucleotide-binding domain-containing protein [Gammaproteobacteria bacterium]|nr:cyclic nucleotide-binding domain-containing protein [Gammaproteobacteria bacterium]